MTEEEKKKDEVSAVRCTTSAGPIAMEFHREWSPNGYDRAIELFERGFYDDSHFFRVVPKFLVQFGISYSTDQDLQKLGHAPILDDPKHEPEIPFEEGTISYAGEKRKTAICRAMHSSPEYLTCVCFRKWRQ
jgi:cyclophilin family peptidyl-prolyl cis-trans isomerase